VTDPLPLYISQQNETGRINNSIEVRLSAHCRREKRCEIGSSLEDESLPLSTSLSFIAITVEVGRIRQAYTGPVAWLLFSYKTNYALENKLFYTCDLSHIV
jgi:hypothetical protein